MSLKDDVKAYMVKPKNAHALDTDNWDDLDMYTITLVELFLSDSWLKI